MNSDYRDRPPFDLSYFTLGAPVGPEQPNRREDVIKVETLLGNTGHLDLTKTDGPLGLWSERPEQAVKAYQTEKGLKVDGLLNPGGPTMGSLKGATSGLLGWHTPPSSAQVDEHHDRLQRGEPGLLNLRPARLSFPQPSQPMDLDEQTLAFNADSAQALTRSSVNGGIPSIYANYVKQVGAEAKATIYDLAEQVNGASGRDRVDQVLHGIVGQLAPDQVRTLLGGTTPTGRPLGVLANQLPDDENVPLFHELALAAFPPVPMPDPPQGPTPTGGGEPDPTPTPAPKPPLPIPEPRPIPPIPKPEPRPTPAPDPEPRPEPTPEPPKDDKCKDLRATLERGRANLRDAENAWADSVAAFDRAVASENTAWDGFVGSATQAAAGVGSNCISGLRQPVTGNARVVAARRVLNCLGKVFKDGGLITDLSSVWDALSQWKSASSQTEAAKLAMDDKLSRLNEQKYTVADLENRMQRAGCN